MKKATADMRALKDRLLRAALPHMPFDGWSEASLRHAADDVGVERAAIRRAFPRGAIDLALYHSAVADRQMEERLAKENLAALKLRERVARAVRLRLEPHAGEREAIHQALSLLVLPPYAPDALRALYRTVDAVWYAVGDRSTDFSFYTKRLLLAGVYVSTLLCWLGDRSAGQGDTWAFLERRIADVMRIQKARGRLEALLEGGPRLFARLQDAFGPPRSPRGGRTP